MNSGDIIGRDYASGQPIRLRWQDGRITHREPAPAPPTEDVWLAPSLVDLQVNGYAGVDFQDDHLSLDALAAATRQLRAAGCGRYLLTLITDEWPRLTARLRRLRSLRAQSPELQHAIAGWHLEGPFLSPEPGFRGAHDPTVMLDPTPAHIEELRAIVERDPLLVTLAPERTGALEAIHRAVECGIKISLGHTNASAEILRQAVQAGATGFTHLGNGCPRDLDRHDNILWRVLESEGLTVGLIADRIHVSPSLFRLVHWVLGPHAIYYTTDAMSAAGAPPGRYRLRHLELEVGADQIVRLPGTPNFAGSALRPIDGIFRAAAMLKCSWREVWPRFSLTPSALLGWPGDLQPGAEATFCVLQFDARDQLASLRVCCQGTF
ncbi:MAG: N-acetylglucosamine-6-phosphate deacetylase [Verrucomicrobia bacterium]|nr:N-acetylglucosamine-6-phosphate deacetylase [Verrucomicrobiota bacterium]